MVDGLPDGWEMKLDKDAHVFYVNHITKTTSRIDPRLNKADCGEQLAYGWEEQWNVEAQRFVYIDHVNQRTQLHDPREQWRRAQTDMVEEYLSAATQQLAADETVLSAKQQRAAAAEQELARLSERLAVVERRLQACMSVQHLPSTSQHVHTMSMPSLVPDHAIDTLRSELQRQRERVNRLKEEKGQLVVKVERDRDDVDRLANELNQARSSGNVVDELRAVQSALRDGEQERQSLLRSLLAVDGGVTAARTQLFAAMQEYERLRAQLLTVQSRMNTHQLAMDEHQLKLLWEKQQLLREFNALDRSQLDANECGKVDEQKTLLHRALCDDLNCTNGEQLQYRLQLNEQHEQLCCQLRQVSVRVTELKQTLRSLSASTLSSCSSSNVSLVSAVARSPAIDEHAMHQSSSYSAPVVSSSTAVSDESLAGDSGVFDTSCCAACPQVYVILKYDVNSRSLDITLAQCRYLDRLPGASSEVRIQYGLQPYAQQLVVTRTLVCDNDGKVNVQHCTTVQLPMNVVRARSLLVNVRCKNDIGKWTTVGTAQLSLAEFNQHTLTQWVNVLAPATCTEDVESSDESTVIGSQPSTLTRSGLRTTAGVMRIIVNTDDAHRSATDISERSSFKRHYTRAPSGAQAAKSTGGVRRKLKTDNTLVRTIPIDPLIADLQTAQSSLQRQQAELEQLRSLRQQLAGGMSHSFTDALLNDHMSALKHK